MYYTKDNYQNKKNRMKNKKKLEQKNTKNRTKKLE